MALFLKNLRFNVELTQCSRKPIVSVEKGLMKDSKRNCRIRLLVKRLNQQRKKQATQVDILCNDIIASHRDFLNTVKTLTFAIEFHESLIGVRDLDNLFYTCACAIRNQIPDVSLAFFLSEVENFQVYAFDGGIPQNDQEHQFEQYFTNELVRAVTKANRTCGLDELLGMGLQISPAVLKDIWAVTIPVTEDGAAAGFMLLSKTSPQSIETSQIELLSAVRRGLSRAIKACTSASQTSK